MKPKTKENNTTYIALGTGGNVAKIIQGNHAALEHRLDNGITSENGVLMASTVACWVPHDGMCIYREGGEEKYRMRDEN